MPAPRARTFIGLAKETTKGTAINTPVDYIPVDVFDPKKNIKMLEDKAIRGSAVDIYNEIQGPAFVDIALSGPVFVESFPRLVYSLMGDLTTTGGAAPYTHAFAVLNTGDQQGPAYTMVHYNGVDTRAYSGVQVAELDLKLSGDGLFEYSGKAVGYAMTTPTIPTPAFNVNPPQPGWAASLTLATVADLTVEHFECKLARPTAPIHNIDTTQDPYKVWQGPLSVKGKFTFVFETVTDYNYYLSNTQPAAVLTLTQGAGATVRSTTITMTKCAFMEGTKPVFGKDYVELEAPFTAVANTTDVGASAGFGLAKVTFQSAVTAYAT